MRYDDVRYKLVHAGYGGRSSDNKLGVDYAFYPWDGEMKTIVVSGMVVRNTRRGDYADVEYSYDVDDSVTVDDVVFYLQRSNRLRTLNQKLNPDGTARKTSFIVSVDSEREMDKSEEKRAVKKGELLDRVGVSQQIKKDLANPAKTKWIKPDPEKRVAYSQRRK